MMEVTTTNFADFGWRERRMAAALLNASCEQGFPEDFYDDQVSIMMNRNSGNVFFTNSDYQVCMMNGDKLESFYTTPYEGLEGFADDFQNMDRDSFHPEDIEYLIAAGILETEEEEDAI